MSELYREATTTDPTHILMSVVPVEPEGEIELDNYTWSMEDPIPAKGKFLLIRVPDDE